MSEHKHDELCQIAADVLGVDWNSFSTEIVSGEAILIRLDSSGECFMVRE